jgi:hypothetical protein
MSPSQVHPTSRPRTYAAALLSPPPSPSASAPAPPPPEPEAPEASPSASAPAPAPAPQVVAKEEAEAYFLQSLQQDPAPVVDTAHLLEQPGALDVPSPAGEEVLRVMMQVGASGGWIPTSGGLPRAASMPRFLVLFSRRCVLLVMTRCPG